jgi:hypothetical protein
MSISAQHVQVSNISAGTGAPNVIPGEQTKARFNLRFSTEQMSKPATVGSIRLSTANIRWNGSVRSSVPTAWDTVCAAMRAAPRLLESP